MVWGTDNAARERTIGAGHVIRARVDGDLVRRTELYPDYNHAAAALKTMGVLPDFESDVPLRYVHRRDGDTDIYFVANQKERSEDIQVTFRVGGREAELWHPDTGKIEPAEYKIENGHTSVPLHFDPYGSLFVVFRKTADAPARTLPHLKITELAKISGPWQVRFPPNWGAPPQIELDQLISWTACPEDGVKYFSGTATYTKEFSIPERSFAPSP